MSSVAKTNDILNETRRYDIKYPATEYTYPREAVIHEVKIDENFINVELTDGRILSIPMWWIPSVYNAPPQDRLKFEINRGRTMLIWDPEKGSINDEIKIEDYLAPQAAE